MTCIHPYRIQVCYESPLPIEEVRNRFQKAVKPWKYTALLNGDAIAGKLEINQISVRKACILYRGSEPLLEAILESSEKGVRVVGSVTQNYFDYFFLFFFVLCSIGAAFSRKTTTELWLFNSIAFVLVVVSFFSIQIHRRRSISAIERFLKEKLSATPIING